MPARDGTDPRRGASGARKSRTVAARSTLRVAQLTTAGIAQPSSLRNQVEAVIAASIISGEIRPGDIVSVPALAAQFNVSATPVREAMLDLEKRGFVEAIRNRGFRVTTISPADLEEVVAVRLLLEPAAMAQLATTFEPKSVGEYRSLADRIVGGAHSADLRTFLEADERFHLSLLEALGNRRLLEIVRDLRSRTRLTGLVGLVNTEELMVSADEHHLLLDLLVEGDGPAAEKLMKRHVRHILGWWAGEPEADDSAEPGNTSDG
jgi:DNA-binding GntR family transcriptional regulator